MTTIKKLQYILYAVIITMTSCNKDFVKLNPTDKISDDNAYSTPNAVQALMISLYERISWNFEDQRFGEGGPGNYTWIWTDEAHGSYTWSPTAYSNNVSDNFHWWDYVLIKDLNDFIAKIPTASVEEGLRTRYLAEAKFLRAYIYFSMAKRYGGVPIVDKVLIEGEDDLKVQRNKLQEVYDFVEKDLDAAIEGLLAKYEDGTSKFRATKYAAYALKSRAMLYAGSEAKYGSVQLNGMIGIEKSLAQSYFKKSFDAASEIVKNPDINLYKGNSDPAANFQKIFDGSVDVNSNSEVLLAKGYGLPNNGYNFDFYNAPESFKAGWGSYTNPTADFVEDYEYTDGTPGKLKIRDNQGNLIKYSNPADLFKNKDPRFFATILFPNATWNSNGNPQGNYIGLRRGIIVGKDTLQSDDANQKHGTGNFATNYMGKDGPSTSSGDYTKTGFYIRKYLTESSSFVPSWNQSENPGILFRYGEVLLNYAEAALEINDFEQARWAINQIRERAGMPAHQAIDMDKIRHERKIELAFEHHRYWDLRRWHIADKILNNKPLHALHPFLVWEENTDPSKMSYVFKIVQIPNRPTRTFLNSTYYFRIDNTGANTYLVQNPGY